MKTVVQSKRGVHRMKAIVYPSEFAPPVRAAGSETAWIKQRRDPGMPKLLTPSRETRPGQRVSSRALAVVSEDEEKRKYPHPKENVT
jgi:hypothetical protein